MKRVSAVPFMLSSYPTRSRFRRAIGRTLRGAGALLFFVAGLPLAVGRGLMWLAGRANGAAYQVERNK